MPAITFKLRVPSGLYGEASGVSLIRVPVIPPPPGVLVVDKVFIELIPIFIRLVAWKSTVERKENLSKV